MRCGPWPVAPVFHRSPYVLYGKRVKAPEPHLIPLLTMRLLSRMEKRGLRYPSEVARFSEFCCEAQMTALTIVQASSAVSRGKVRNRAAVGRKGVDDLILGAPYIAHLPSDPSQRHPGFPHPPRQAGPAPASPPVRLAPYFSHRHFIDTLVATWIFIRLRVQAETMMQRH